MSFCLKLLLALTLFVIITECRPQGPGGRPRRAKRACKDDADCSPRFSCVQTPKGKKCAKPAAPAVKPNLIKSTTSK